MRVTHAGLVLATLVVLAAFACDETSDDDPGSSSSGSSSSSSSGGAKDGSTTPGLDGSSSSGGPDGSSPEGGGGGGSFVYRDINHILGTGQSLSVGAVGSPALSKVQPYRNFMFSTGAIAGATNLTEWVPLIEGVAPVDVETLSSSLANLITKLARNEVFASNPEATRSHDILVSGHGIGGTPYSGLKKGTKAFADGIAQVQAAKQIASDTGKTYVVRAITNVHGESDHIAVNTAYLANLVEWQSDYEVDVKAITGQADHVPMLHTQMSSWTKFAAGTTSQVTIDQLTAHVQHPGLIVLVGPKYHLAYVADGVHLTNAGYRHMGEDYAKVYRRMILEGKPWEPVRPIAVTHAGAKVTLKFAVPSPPLALDTTAVSDPGNFGFEVADPGGATITNVALAGADSVTITLSAAPAAGARIRYAFTGVAGAAGGPTTGPRGNLRDSDATESRYGFSLYNWCVHFDEPIP